MTAKMWKYGARTKRLLGRPAGEASVTLVDERGTTHAPSLSLLYSRRQFERARNERRARRGPSTSLIGHWIVHFFTWNVRRYSDDIPNYLL